MPSFPRRPRLLPLALAGACLLFGRLAQAQIGVSTDIITGVVLGQDSLPLAGATVQAVSTESQVSRERTTDAKGRFTIVFPDGGGQYQLNVRAIGMAPARINLARQADEDRLVVTVRLTTVAMQLPEITTRGRPRVPRDLDRSGPGSTERILDPGIVERLPIDASDLNALATLVPGVVGVGATDSTDAAFSVAGQRTTANDITLDGVSVGSGAVPQDAIRSTRVVTSAYDVALGKFSGGLVSSTTRAGTNVPSGSFSYNLRSQALSWGSATSSAFGRAGTQNQLGGGFGGPIVSNRLFVFGSLQGRWSDQALPSLATADPATLLRLGVSPDSVTRLLTLLDGSGIPSATDLPDDRASNNLQGLVRFDAKLSDAQSITVRVDGRWTSQEPTRVGTLSFPETGGTRSQHGGGVMATLTSYFTGNLINEARAYIAANRNDGAAYLLFPQGRVQLASNLTDTTTAVSTLTFGGSPTIPQRTTSRNLEFSDEFSWLPGAATHRLKFGVDVTGAHLEQDRTSNQLGTFYFNSLAALEAGQPSQFTRNLAELRQEGTSWNSALYLGDTWRASPALQVTYGARVERSSFSGAPQYNPVVDSLFGLRTDHIPTETHLSPRAGFTWMPGAGMGRVSTTIIRGGIGDFRSPTPTSLYSSALAAPGFSNAERQLLCIGPAAPTPEWTDYATDQSSIPSTCVDTVTTIAITARPNVTLFDPNFTAPRAIRASLGVQRRLAGTYSLSVNATYARGVSQNGFRDLNFLDTPRFTLASEGGRPVYVPADSIDATTGTLGFGSSRRYTDFGQVLQMRSDLASDTKQLTIGLSGLTGRGAMFQFSYTYMRSRDESSFSPGFGGGSGTTSGDPNVREWGTSGLERRHAFLATMTYPVTGSFEVTTIARLSSGAPFTPLVGGDINGDGSRNDRAFIFDPATAEPAIADAMRDLLNGLPSGVRNCLESQLGRVAGRNSCRGPWQPSVDLQLNWRPSYFGLDRRMTVALVTSNLLGGLDELFHDSDDLHGWGAAAIPDPVLLYVRGFDPGTERFAYQVNGRFGSRRSANEGIIAPFQISIQARLTIGPDRTRDRLRSAFGPGGGAGGPGGGPGGPGGGPGGAPGDFAARFAQMMPNPIAGMLELKDSIGLSPEQAAQLQTISDTLAAKMHAIAEVMRIDVEKAGSRPDPGVLFAKLRPRLTESRELMRKAVADAQAAMTPEQWAKVPDPLKLIMSGQRNRERP